MCAHWVHIKIIQFIVNLSHAEYFYPSDFFYPPTKSEGYSFGVVRPSGTISQYLLVRFDSFLVQMISTMDSQTSNKFGQNQPLNTWVIALVLV